MAEMEATVFKWVAIKLKDQEHIPMLNSGAICEKYGVPRRVFQDYVDSEVAQSEACWSLPFTLLLVVSYAMVAISHDDAATVRAVEDSLDHDVAENANFAFVGDYIGHKGADNVNSYADFWSFVSKGFVPLIFPQEYGWSEGYDTTDQRYIDASGPTDRGVWLNYNRIVGGVRFQQEYDDAKGCVSKKELSTFYGMSCVGGTDYDLDPEMLRARRSVEPTRTWWLYSNEDQSVMQRRVWEHEESRWLDRGTRKIEIAVPVYSAEFGIHTLLYINFYMSRGGHIWKRTIPLSTWASWHKTWTQYIGDLVWLFCILYILVNEVKEIMSVVQRTGAASLLTEYVGFWNAFDWISLTSAFAVLIMFIVALVASTGVNDRMDELINHRPQNATAIEEWMNMTNATVWPADVYSERVREYVTELEECVQYVHQLRLAIAAYPLIIIGRLFKAYSAQPRLALVTKTLKNAMPDLAHFAVVIMSVFLVFAVSGVVLFGREVTGFATVVRGMLACFRMLFGDLMWDEISKIGRMEANVWLLLFMIVVVMLLLNMLLAIIMNHYVAVKDAAQGAETLWDQGFKSYKLFFEVRRGESVPIEHVQSALIKHDAQKAQEAEEDEDGGDEEELDEMEDILMVSDLKNLFQAQMKIELPDIQCYALLEKCIEAYYRAHHQNVDMEEVMVLTRKVEHRTKKLVRMSKEYKKHASGDNEVNAVLDFARELAFFTDELRAEKAAQRSEIEELRAIKRGLIMQAPQELEIPTGQGSGYSWKLGNADSKGGGHVDAGPAGGGHVDPTDVSREMASPVFPSSPGPTENSQAVYSYQPQAVEVEDDNRPPSDNPSEVDSVLSV